MDRAKERAIERCPKSENVIEEMRNEIKRAQFVEGYHQAEKDLALTAEDVGVLVNIIQEDYNNRSSIFGMFKRVAKRFNESRTNEQKGS